LGISTRHVLLASLLLASPHRTKKNARKNVAASVKGKKVVYNIDTLP
jgi:hypothetical protein